MEFKIELRIERDAERQGEFKIVRENEFGEKCVFDRFLINVTEKNVLVYPSFQTLTLLGVELKDKWDFGTYLKLLKKFGIELQGGYKSHWKPEEDGTDFYWIDDSGHVQENKYSNDFAFRRGYSNAFPSYELAEMAINTSKLGRLILLWQYNNDCLYTLDVKDKKNRYTIKFSSILNELVCVEVSYTQGDSVYFETEEQCKAFIEMYKDEIKKLWGV